MVIDYEVITTSAVNFGPRYLVSQDWSSPEPSMLFQCRQVYTIDFRTGAICRWLCIETEDSQNVIRNHYMTRRIYEECIEGGRDLMSAGAEGEYDPRADTKSGIWRGKRSAIV